MVNFFFPKLGQLFGASGKSAAPEAPAFPIPVAVPLDPVRAEEVKLDEPVPEPVRPVPDELADKPDIALAHILKVKSLPTGSTPATSTDVRERTLSALNKLDEIPALKSLAAGFARTMNRENVTVDEVVAALSKDSSLVVRILRMANSVMVSSEQRINRLDVAVQMLGVERMRKAAEAVFILSTASKTTEGLDWKHLWVHALGTAAISEQLEQMIRGRDSSSVYIAGLLHDVGKIVLSTIAPIDYRQILIAAWNDKDRLTALEVSRLGLDHGEAGVAFANQNKMGNIILEVVAHHTRPEQAEIHRFEVAAVSVANYLAKAYGLGYSGARLDTRDGEFADLPAWRIIEEETGMRPNLLEIETKMKAYAKKLRLELSALRQGL